MSADIYPKTRGGEQEWRGEEEEEDERERGDGRTQTDESFSRRRRNIKLNKRSIFCSLFLTRGGTTAFRHTLFSSVSSSPSSPVLALVGLPLSFSLLLPSSAAPARASTLFLPFGRFPLSHSSFPPPPSPPALFRFLASPSCSLSLSLSFSSTARASKRAAQRRGTLSK